MAHAVVLPSGAAPSPVALESRCLTVEPLDNIMENFDEDDDFMNNNDDEIGVGGLDIPDDSSLDDE